MLFGFRDVVARGLFTEGAESPLSVAWNVVPVGSAFYSTD